MRSRIARGAYVLGILAVVCALIGGKPARAGAAQEPKKQTSEQAREAQRQLEQRQAEQAAKTKHQEELAKKKQEEAAAQQQQYVPEIDGASIPTALALLGASLVMLRARLRSK
jgi:hypothetical protein